MIGELGHNLMDHHFLLGADGVYDGFEDNIIKARMLLYLYLLGLGIWVDLQIIKTFKRLWFSRRSMER